MYAQTGMKIRALAILTLISVVAVVGVAVPACSKDGKDGKNAKTMDERIEQMCRKSYVRRIEAHNEMFGKSKKPDWSKAGIPGCVKKEKAKLEKFGEEKFEKYLQCRVDAKTLREDLSCRAKLQ
jgi:hypothetical protein